MNEPVIAELLHVIAQELDKTERAKQIWTLVSLCEPQFEKLARYHESKWAKRLSYEDLYAESVLAFFIRVESRRTPIDLVNYPADRFVAKLFQRTLSAVAKRMSRQLERVKQGVHETYVAARTVDNQTRLEIFESLEQLPDLERRVAELRFVYRSTINEIALDLNKSYDSVANIVKKVGHRLQFLLSK